MSSGAEPVPPGELRASDVDRNRVAQVLHDAAGEGRLGLDELAERLDAAYAARTYAELEPLTRDLPAGGAALVQRPAAAAAQPVASPADRQGAGPPSVAVLSEVHRAGDWLVGERHTALAVLGGVKLDLRQARLAAPEVTIAAYAVLGNVKIIVPEQVSLRVEGFGLMGGFSHVGHDGGPDAPLVRVVGFAFLGAVEVRRRRVKRVRAELPPAE